MSADDSSKPPLKPGWTRITHNGIPTPERIAERCRAADPATLLAISTLLSLSGTDLTARMVRHLDGGYSVRLHSEPSAMTRIHPDGALEFLRAREPDHGTDHGTH